MEKPTKHPHFFAGSIGPIRSIAPPMTVDFDLNESPGVRGRWRHPGAGGSSDLMVGGVDQMYPAWL